MAINQMKLYLLPAAATGILALFSILDLGPGQYPAACAEKSVCSDIEKRYDDILSSAGVACRSNADCGCYGPASRKSGCGGVTDKRSADRLRELARDFQRAGCNYHIQCAPWFCNPVCEREVCMNKRQMH